MYKKNGIKSSTFCQLFFFREQQLNTTDFIVQTGTKWNYCQTKSRTAVELFL